MSDRPTEPRPALAGGAGVTTETEQEEGVLSSWGSASPVDFWKQWKKKRRRVDVRFLIEDDSPRSDCHSRINRPASRYSLLGAFTSAQRRASGLCLGRSCPHPPDERDAKLTGRRQGH